jgi:hypothetical protein
MYFVVVLFSVCLMCMLEGRMEGKLLSMCVFWTCEINELECEKKSVATGTVTQDESNVKG